MARRNAGPGNTVSVICKIPMGLELRLFGWETKTEAVLGGGHREFKIAKAMGEPIIVHGPAVPMGKFPRTPIIGGYRITRGIPRDFWDEWLKQNTDHHAVVNGLITAAEDEDWVEDYAKEHRKNKSGIQPLDVTVMSVKGAQKLSDPRIEEATSMSVSPIQEGERDAARELVRPDW